MEVYFFKSTTKIGAIAFTLDQSGTNLPSNVGPWEHPKGTTFLAEWLADEVRKAINRDGYWVSAPQ